ncbi:hypothetical protein [Calderihabitans maritimus]|uniref:Uncharacterized protein n=1 Tax=Calderihabitans maritimus TaxID=1246530 RepID=A0A1Z5HXJ8_9FIRM|nr:hypothetical protein [Calderihabitans maritimus]GAW94000.1 hypothetical protein KKC1_31200 [Calderihabitans maritimus]
MNIGKNYRQALGESSFFRTKLFSLKTIINLSLCYVMIVILSNVTIRYLSKLVGYNPPTYWPISIFSLRLLPTVKQFLLALAIFILFHFIIKKLLVNTRLYLIITSGIILILLTNLLQGWSGLVTPIAGGGVKGIQYYHDAIKISNPLYFLSHFEELQPNLLVHSQTHPPGAVLLFYLMYRSLKKPELMVITIIFVSVVLSVYFLKNILAEEFDNNISNYVSFLFLLIPSIQIYYLHWMH